MHLGWQRLLDGDMAEAPSTARSAVSQNENAHRFVPHLRLTFMRHSS